MAKIVVTGSYITDIAAVTSRFPRDGETVIGETVKIGPGGKGSNQATACKRLGAEVVLITKTGNDYLRNVALTHYKNENISDKYVFVDEENQTGVAIIQIHKSSAENRILVTPGANNHITEEDVYKAEEEFKTCDIVLLQLEASMESVRASINLAKKYNKTVVLNPAPVKELDDEMFGLIDYFTPNETEAEFYSGIKADSIQNMERMAELFIAKGVGNVIITLGKAGAFVKTRDSVCIIPAYTVNAVDTTGAGDAFNGGLCVALAEGKGIVEAAKFANAVAALSVTKLGASESMPDRLDVDSFLKNIKRGVL